MKKILIIIPSLKLWWGAEKVASVFWTELNDQWYDVSYLTFYESEKKYDFKWKYFSLNEKLQDNLFMKVIKLFLRAYKISKFCKNNNIEISVSFMEDANFSVILSKILFFNKSKIIISIRHSLFDYWKWMYFYLIKLLYRFANKIVILTEFEKNNLINNFWIKKNKVKIIYNPIDLKLINNLKKEEIEDKYKNIFDSWKFTFINIWRLNKIKNQKLLIETFKEFNKKYPNTQLIILWDWELKKELQQLACDNQDIYFLWNQKNVYKFLVKSNCFILSSFSEAFPNVIIEAMSCNLPIISSETQWWNEIILDNKYWILFKNNNKQDLFKAMEWIYLDKDLREKYKEKSIERSKDFNLEKIIKEWEEIL